HAADEVGGWDTVIRREEYEKLFFNQQSSMDAPEEKTRDLPAETAAEIAAAAGVAAAGGR
ncbi:MAG: hypothetical protein IJR61_03450, partial [Clostridia bacterium]|nr:hypothetical protein [Clostridia bacterium]